MKKLIRSSPFPVLLFTIVLGCGSTDHPAPTPDEPSTTPNILLIIADDMGKDATNGFSEGTTKPTTPHLDGLKNSGLTFNNLWVNPTCSPTRASIITGKYGYRTGVKWAGDALSSSENILQNYINQQTNGTYASAIVGKWHLAGDGNATFNPETLGMDYYAGLIGGGVQDYYQWSLTEDGARSAQTSYITEKFTDLAIDWVGNQEKPWFLWLAYNAPHTPFHTPPSEMHSQGSLPDWAAGMDGTRHYMAAIEAMDFQIGRLLNSLTQDQRQNTMIIFMGDNGTPNQVAQAPYSLNTAKGTVYQGGINTPMFISGPGVTRTGSDNNLITSTDLFATIAEIAGVTVPEINDSKSFKNLLSTTGTHRTFQYSEMQDGSNDLWTIRNEQYKMIINADGTEELYHLAIDPYEANNLLNNTLSTGASAGKSALETELQNIRN